MSDLVRKADALPIFCMRCVRLIDCANDTTGNFKNNCPIKKELDNLPSAEPHWILCSEKLPEDGTEVFVYLFNRPSPYIAWIKDCRWYTEDFEVESENEPIAWMPLPEPYKGGE